MHIKAQLNELTSHGPIFSTNVIWLIFSAVTEKTCKSDTRITALKVAPGLSRFISVIKYNTTDDVVTNED